MYLDKHHASKYNINTMRRLHHLSFITVLIFLGGVACVIILGYFVFWYPKVIEVLPGEENLSASLDSDILIRFDKPVDRRSLEASLEPSIDGHWSFENPILGSHFFRAIRFQPNRVLDPETHYTVKLNGMSDLFSLGPKRDFETQFQTNSLPAIDRVAPSSVETLLSPNAPVEVHLSNPAPDFAQYRFRLQPDIEVAITQSPDLAVYTLTPAENWQQGTEYALTVERIFAAQDRHTGHMLFQGEPDPMYQGNFAIAPPPNLETVSPTGNQVEVTQSFRLTFTQAMDLSSITEHFSTEPDIEGEFTLSEDGKELLFTPSEALAYATEYTVKVSRGAATADGGFLPEDSSYSFTTIGPVQLSYNSPNTDAQGIDPASSIRLTFNQAVQHASAEQAFRISPSVEGSFRWEENTMIFQPESRLAYGQSYSVDLAAGIEGEKGPASERTYHFAFTTAPETVLLAVTSDLQDKPLSCEAAALKMALANKGVQVSENDIMARVPTNGVHRSGNVWGDPYLEFVGDINGKQNSTGYGVYWGPIAAAGNAWRSSEAFTGWSIQQLTAEIQRGNAVVVWGVYGNGYRDDWVTPEGKSIYAWKGEHARTVIGFVGTPDNPQRIILNDPYDGRISWTRARFEQDWGIFGNAGVVVR